MVSQSIGEPNEQAVAKDILDKYGRSSLDFYKLWPAKSYFFGQDGTCVIAYKKALGVALCLGDPTGPDDRLEGCIREFKSFCSRHGSRVAFHQTMADLLPVYRKLGLRVIKFGEEAVVSMDHFSSVTAEKKVFRYMRHRFERDGYTFSRHLPPHPGELLDETKEVSDEWLTIGGKREHGFATGWFDRAYLSEMPLDLVRDSAGSLVAFVNEIPNYRPGGAEIDLMRHRVKAPNSTMEYLISMILLALATEGYTRLSLGLVPFSGMGSHVSANREETLIHLLFEHANRFFSFKGLYRFKNKFEPEWEARFLIYEGSVLGLMRTLLAEMRLTGVTE
jgi:phosphatidylglycerol lysyltransferase